MGVGLFVDMHGGREAFGFGEEEGGLPTRSRLNDMFFFLPIVPALPSVRIK